MSRARRLLLALAALALGACPGGGDGPMVTCSSETLRAGCACEGIWSVGSTVSFALDWKGEPPRPLHAAGSATRTTPVEVIAPAAVDTLQADASEDPLLLEIRAFAGSREVTARMQVETLAPEVVRFYERCPGWGAATTVTAQGPFVVLRRVAPGTARLRVSLPGSSATPREVTYQMQ